MIFIDNFLVNYANSNWNKSIIYTWIIFIHFFTFSISQLSPSSKPYWVFAEHAVIVHFLVFISYIFKCYKIFLNQFLLDLAAMLGLSLVYLRILARAHFVIIFPKLKKFYHEKLLQFLPSLFDSLCISWINDVN